MAIRKRTPASKPRHVSLKMRAFELASGWYFGNRNDCAAQLASMEPLGAAAMALAIAAVLQGRYGADPSEFAQAMAHRAGLE